MYTAVILFYARSRLYKNAEYAAASFIDDPADRLDHLASCIGRHRDRKSVV